MTTPPVLPRLWWALVRPRGDVVWTGIIRGTGIAGLVGLVALALAPVTAPLVGFVLATVWVNGPIGMFLPAGYEPILMGFGRLYPPLLVALIGVLGTLYVEYLNYLLYGTVIGSRAMAGVRENRGVVRVTNWFRKAPFFTVWLCALTPLPYWVVRILAPLASYPIPRYLAATFLGRFPRLWFFAALGATWAVDMRWVLAVSLLLILLPVGAAIHSARRTRPRAATPRAAVATPGTGTSGS